MQNHRYAYQWILNCFTVAVLVIAIAELIVGMKPLNEPLDEV